MVYRTLSDLCLLVRSNLHKVPHDIDLVVGIPRSGMLPASMIALYLNKRLADIDSFVEGRLMSAGERSEYFQDDNIKKVLIVDDSVNRGNAIKNAQAKLKPIAEKYELIYLAPIVTSEGKKFVDVYFEIIDDWRVFEWNLMHHEILLSACVDIDGVLNVDPTFEIDDDGPTYVNFLQNAVPLFLPTAPIDTLISCRLEKYRSQTEKWLQQHNVEYNNLVMLNMPSKQARLHWGRHGEYKAEYFKSRKDLSLFVESCVDQARIIAEISQKPVVCIETNSLILPKPKQDPFLTRIKRLTRKKIPKVYSVCKNVFGKKW